MVDINDPRVAEIAAFKCTDSLLYHTRFHYKRMHNRKYFQDQHVLWIAEALEKVLRGETRRLIICVPPRYGKTELGVINFISHALSLNPQAKFIHLSATDSLALDNSEKTKEIVQSEAYQKLFPYVKVKRATDSKKKWYTEQGGGLYATSAAGQVTGFGAGLNDDEETEAEKEDRELAAELDGMFVDASGELQHNITIKQKFGGAIIIDDAIKPDDTDSEIKRDKVNKRWNSTIKSRVNSRNTAVIVIMQRLHPDDLAGYLLRTEPDEWTVLNLPAIIPDGQGGQAALCPRKHTLDELLQMRKVDPFIFDRQYMQDPKSKEGLLFPEEELHFYNPGTVDVEKLAEYRFLYADPADEGGDDFAAPTAYLIADKIYIPTVLCNTKGTDHNGPECLRRIIRAKCNAVEFEGNSAWVLLAKQIRDALFKKMRHCDFRIVKNTKNKQTRIRAQSSFIKEHFVFSSDYLNDPDYAKFMQRLTSYLIKATGSQHDDAPDSLAGVAAHMMAWFAHLWPVYDLDGEEK